MDWIQLKIQIEALTGLDRDALHVYAALIGFIAAALVLRRTLASPIPWLLVLAAELVNEAWDIHSDGLVEQWEIDGAKHDIWNTMLAPTLLLLVARIAPGVMRRCEAPAPAAAPAELDDVP
jgi:hypothetical protein